MKLTSHHVEALQAQKHDAFIEDMVLFFEEHDPFHAEALGPEGLCEALRTGVQFARADGITQRDPVRVYLQLMFYLGGPFARDPLMPWTRPILDAATPYASQARRVEDLRQAAVIHLRDTCGSDGAPLRDFMRAFAPCVAAPPELSDAQIVAFLQEHYPLKSEAFGAASVQHLVADSAKRCAQAGLSKRGSVLYLSVMRFVYGSWALDDPLFPWLRVALKPRPTAPDTDAFLARLAQSFFERVEAHVLNREADHVG